MDRQAALELADEIDRSKLVYVAATTALITLHEEDLPRRLEKVGFDVGSTVRLGRADGSYYECLDFWKALHVARMDPAFDISFMRDFQSMMLSRVGQVLSDYHLYDQSPQHEFMRHLRNAVSHGNRWYFIREEPTRPAIFAGISLDKSWHLKPVLYEDVKPGDVFDLLDYIAGSIRIRAL